jgi:hypothetical protein
VIEHLLNHLLRRQFNDVQRRVSLSNPIYDKIHGDTIVLKSTSIAQRLAILQLTIFTILMAYVFMKQKPIAYQVVSSLLFLIGVFSVLRAFISKLLVSPNGISSVFFFAERNQLRWCDINGVGYFEPGNSLIISGLGRKITVGVFSKGIYQAALMIKQKVDEKYWSENALKWFVDLEGAVELKKPISYV